MCLVYVPLTMIFCLSRSSWVLTFSPTFSRWPLPFFFPWIRFLDKVGWVAHWVSEGRVVLSNDRKSYPMWWIWVTINSRFRARQNTTIYSDCRLYKEIKQSCLASNNTTTKTLVLFGSNALTGHSKCPLYGPPWGSPMRAAVTFLREICLLRCPRRPGVSARSPVSPKVKAGDPLSRFNCWALKM